MKMTVSSFRDFFEVNENDGFLNTIKPFAYEYSG